MSSRPSSPRTAITMYRLSAILPFAFAVVSFALTLVFVLAGREPGELEGQFLVSINASNVGQDIIRFERATSTSTAPSATSSASSNPLDPLNPLSPGSPLNPNNPNNPLNVIFNPILDNITNAINDGVGDAVNEVASGFIEGAGVRDQYVLYQQKICEGDARLDKCSRYEDKEAGFNAIISNLRSSIVVGTTNVSVPLVAQLGHSINTLSSGIESLRKAVLAFLIISMIGAGMSALSAIPSILFSQSRLLIYTNLFWPSLAATFAFLAACILTGLVVGIVSVVDGFGEAVSLFIKQGNSAILFVWLAWVFVFLDSCYWFGVWFVEVRTWTFVRRRRTDDQRGNWRGVVAEVRSDLKGEKDL